MSAAAREARRRKILERGSDRFALITGQIQSLPSSSKPLISDDQHVQSLVPDEPSVSHNKDKLVDSALEHQEPQIDDVQSNRGSSAPPSSKYRAQESAEACISEDGERQPPHHPSEGQDSARSASARVHHSTPPVPPLGSISLNQISSAVSNSEKMRLCFSAAIAFIAVVSYIGFPFIGQSFIRTIFGFRPLYVVLLTSATVVLWRVLFAKQKSYGAAVGGESQVAAVEGHGSAEQIGKIIEAGLGIRKVVDAIFMDCSVFLVIIVSGLSFLQQLKN